MNPGLKTAGLVPRSIDTRPDGTFESKSCTANNRPSWRNRRISAAGGQLNVTVTAPANCLVNAKSFQPWVSVAGITPSNGTTTVTLQISASAGAARTTSIALADRLFLVTQ